MNRLCQQVFAVALSAGLGVLALTAGPVLAQPSASQLTPRDLRPDTPDTSVPPVLVPQAPDTPSSALPDEVAALQVTLAEIRVEDGFADLADTTARLIAPFRGRRSTVQELQALAQALETLYGEAGYFLVRVTIPPQDVVDGGELRLQVIDGHLEAINLDAVPARLRNTLQSRLQGLLQQPRLKASEVERALLLAGRTPGLQIRSALVPGQGVGAAVLVLEGDYRVFSGSWSADNRLSDTLGPWQSTWQLQLNQPLAQGEQFYAYLGGHPNPGRMLRSDALRRVAGAGVNWPLGSHGAALNLEVTRSDTRMPSSNPWIPETRSRFERAALRLSYPLHLSRRSEVSLTGIYEASRQYNEIPEFDVELTRDELSVLRLNLSAQHQWSPSSRLSLFLQASRGLNSGARTWDDVLETGVPFSRWGGEPDFRKLEMNLGWQWALPQNFQLASTLRWQKAFGGPLPSAELFSLDGEDALSAMESGGLADDGGWTLREELSWSRAFWDGALQLSPYVYVTGGKPRSEVGTFVDYSTAAGVGLRGGSGSLRFSMEYGESRIRPGDFSDETFFARLQVAF